MAKAKTGEQTRSASRMLQVLKSFTSDTPLQTVAEISAQLDLATSTVRRLIYVLEEHGFVRRTPDSNRYALGYQALQIAAVALGSIDLYRSSRPILDWVAQETGEGVQLVVFDDGNIVHIDGRDGRHTVRIYHQRGQRHDARPGSAVGTVLFAYLPTEQVREMLADALWEPPNSRDFTGIEEYLEHLEEVRRDGYAINDGGTDTDVWAVAAPVRDHTNMVVGAIDLPCLRSRVDSDLKASHVATVRQAAQELSQSLGARPSSSGGMTLRVRDDLSL